MAIRINGDNTTAAPGITSNADTDTGIQFSSDEISLVTGGTEKVKVENGALKVTGQSSGITDGGVTLDWESSTQTARIFSESSAASKVKIYTTNSSGVRNYLTIDDQGNLDLGFGGFSGQINGGFGAYSTTSGATNDWNHADNARSGNGRWLLPGTASNGPGGGTYFHIFNFEYISKNGNGNLTQIAWAYNSESLRYMRYRYAGVWSSWNAF